MARIARTNTESTTGDRARERPHGVVPAAQHATQPKPPAGDFRLQSGPPPKGIGAQRVAELKAACKQIAEPIKELAATLPACASALGTARGKLAQALIQQSSVAAEYEAVLAKELPGLEQFALQQAKLAEKRNPTNTHDGVKTHQQEIVRDTLKDWPVRKEKQLAKLAGRTADECVSALANARKAVKQAKLRASLDDTKPNAALVDSIKRTIEAEPTLRQPAKAAELLRVAVEVDDQAVLLALESVIPLMQSVVETGVPRLTRNVSNPATGAPTDALQTAVGVVITLRAMRSDRLAKTSIGLAEEILAALEFLSIKSIGCDLSDPAVSPGRIDAISSPARFAALTAAQLKVDMGKSGCRWVSRYLRSTMPLRLPAILHPQPMANMTSTPPPGNRTPAHKGHPLAKPQAPLPAKLGKSGA